MGPVQAKDFLHRLAADRSPVTLPVLVLAAHPDDEVIGLGGTLPRFRDLRILHVTDGAPRDGRDARAHGFADLAGYAAARRRELAAALALAGLAPDRAETLGIPDQEATPNLTAIVAALRDRLDAWRPAVVITHPYEGGHPDHDATALAAALACREGGPALVEMTSYHAAPQGIAIGRFLSAEGCTPVTLELDAATRDLKRRMLACFASQQATLSQFEVAGEELLRPAPAYDFAQPPHAGQLLYERFPWGMTGARFRDLARGLAA
jgi:LmbE family N-acetylglucosaminyl deacetylase